MQPGAVVFQGKLGETNIVIRYPVMEDLEVLVDFINAASAERTYIRIQGVTLTLSEEALYLDDVLSKMKAGNMVKLVVFAGETLLGAVDVTRQVYTEKHLGVFGILVSKAARGKGLGNMLMELVISETKKELEGIETLVLECHAENQVGRHLYKKFGFKEYGLLPKGVKRADGYDDKVMMYLPL